jgi:hypothetical protein
MTVHKNHGNYQSSKHYRGRFNFFSPNETCQKLFDGPVHIHPNGDPQEWPFALTIPTNPSPRWVRAGNDRESSYLPLDEEYIARMALPSSFANSGGWIEQFHAFVEYYLEAEFREENKSHAATAELPFSLRAPSMPYPLADFDLKTRIYPARIRTQRLIPGMEHGELSFRQKTQKLLGSSKVPLLWYNVHVDYPAVIQLENPIPIPFKVRVVINRQRTSNIIVDVPQKIELTALNMELRACTSVRCAGTMSPHSASGADKHRFGTVLGLRTPISIPSGSDAKALDIGALLELSLHTTYASAKGKPLSRFASQIYPGFTTFNIRHHHRLRWGFILKIEGESTRVTGEQAVSVQAAS